MSTEGANLIYLVSNLELLIIPRHNHSASQVAIVHKLPQLVFQANTQLLTCLSENFVYNFYMRYM